MDKKKQRSLNKWLKQQSKLAKRWLMIAISLGVLSSVFLQLTQAALLASILHQLIIENVDKSELVGHFAGLALSVVGRADMHGVVKSQVIAVVNRSVSTLDSSF